MVGASEYLRVTRYLVHAHSAAALLGAGSLLSQTSIPEIPFDATANLRLPEHIYMGEAAGVATNSKGNVLVYTRTGANATIGASRTFTHGGAPQKPAEGISFCSASPQFLLARLTLRE